MSSSTHTVVWRAIPYFLPTAIIVQGWESRWLLLRAGSGDGTPHHTFPAHLVILEKYTTPPAWTSSPREGRNHILTYQSIYVCTYVTVRTYDLQSIYTHTDWTLLHIRRTLHRHTQTRTYTLPHLCCVFGGVSSLLVGLWWGDSDVLMKT